MSSKRINISDELRHLQPSDALEKVSMSTLARQGTRVLQRISDTAQAIAVNIQGKGAMVTVSQRQYDEMVQLIQQLSAHQSTDAEFTASLSQGFEDLVTQMNTPDAPEQLDQALFGSPSSLNESYRPDRTENPK